MSKESENREYLEKMAARAIKQYGEKDGAIVIAAARKQNAAEWQAHKPVCLSWYFEIQDAGRLADLEDARKQIRKACQDPEALPEVLKAVDLEWDYEHCPERILSYEIREAWELEQYRRSGRFWCDDL